VAQPRFSFKIRLLEGILKVGATKSVCLKPAQANPNSAAAVLAIRTVKCRSVCQLCMLVIAISEELLIGPPNLSTPMAKPPGSATTSTIWSVESSFDRIKATPRLRAPTPPGYSGNNSPARTAAATA
jgi:hypothetical protein